MVYPILPTKLYIPTTRADLVIRPRLHHKLDGGLTPGFRLTLVSAPAGSGKSTLVSEWARQAGLPVAWLTCDEGDNDPIRFWNYFLAAIQTVIPELGGKFSDLMRSPQPPSVDVLMTSLVNEIASISRPLCIILDDYHLIEDVAIHKNIDFLIDYLPQIVHLLLISRIDPPLHLARRRGRAELCELRAIDLRFSNSEAADFLNQIMKLGLTQGDLDALEARTEGWIVGLQLAALSLQGRQDVHTFISAFEGDDRYVADYLVEEVLNRQPENIRDFLLVTSILHRMNGAVCDALTGGHNSQSILNALENANLFILPLDNRREWFRYHTLFAKLLNQYLLQMKGAEVVVALYHLAIDWHIRNGMIREAVEYALAGKEFELAAQLIGQVIEEMYSRNEFATILRWGEVIPESALIKSPGLCIGVGWSAIATSHPENAEHFIKMIEKSAGISVDQFIAMDVSQQQALPAVILGMMIEITVQEARVAIDRNETLAILDVYSRILPLFTEERSAEPAAINPRFYLKGPMMIIIALAHELRGNTRAAISAYHEAVRLGMQLQNQPIIAQGLGHLGQMQALQGHLHLAAATFDQAMDYSIRLNGQVSGFYGYSMLGMGNLAYEHNDLLEARQLLENGLKQTIFLNDWEGFLPGLVGMAKLQLAEGDVTGAFETSDELIELSHNRPEIIHIVADALRVELLIHQNWLDEAESWVWSQGYSYDSDPSTLPVEHALVLVRLWYARKQFGYASRFLIELQRGAEEEEEWGRWIEICAMKALVLSAMDRQADALNTLDQTLRLAKSEFYVRTLVDLGKSMRDLLFTARKSKDFLSYFDYIDQLLAAFGKLKEEPIDNWSALLLRQPLVEPLSEREIEVIQSMATGASNQEIAQEFTITVNTVKKHISNIFRKLGVETRLQAVERARKLGIIPK